MYWQNQDDKLSQSSIDTRMHTLERERPIISSSAVKSSASSRSSSSVKIIEAQIKAQKAKLNIARLKDKQNFEQKRLKAEKDRMKAEQEHK